MDNSSGQKKFAAIKDYILSQVETAAWPEHSRIPSENELATQFAVSRMTARRALQELTEQGVLYRTQGVGSFVASVLGINPNANVIVAGDLNDFQFSDTLGVLKSAGLETLVERLPLGDFGNRVPNITVELCRVVGELEPLIRSVTVIPGATEFGYDPVARVRVVGMPSACMASLTRYSLSTGPSGARPSPRREKGV